MSVLIFNNITFYYVNQAEKLFNNLSLNLDTNWKLGLIGRNGSGKTTLLHLIDGSFQPLKGNICSDVNIFYFPFQFKSEKSKVLEIIKEGIAPFSIWEAQMETLLKRGDAISISEYGDIFEQYQKADGYRINSIIEKEISEIGLEPEILERDFNLLSGGEQTRAQLVSLFLKKNSFPLIDEPTNHLDMDGRIQLAEYLRCKSGFIVISHDRNFLDLCIDHVLSINKNDITITKGNYSVWKYNFDINEEFEKRKNENIKREIRSLSLAARKRRTWSLRKEKEKTGSYDKGFITHRAAKAMKRALQIERRISRKLEEKKTLLKNVEKKRYLKINKSRTTGDIILNADNISLNFGDHQVFKNFNLTVRKGDRIAIIGKNGSGKTSALNIITRKVPIDKGYVSVPAHYTYFYLQQNPVWVKGMLRDYLKQENIEETMFRNILAALGIEGEIFERPLETFSKGENKKAELAQSFIKPYDVIIWDEPLNYLDIISREMLEDTILKFKPTMIFTEHDIRFVENIATEIIEL